MAKKVKGTALAAAKLFPTEIYVGFEQEGEDHYPIANLDIEPFDDTQAVGVYELKEVRRKQIEHSLL